MRVVRYPVFLIFERINANISITAFDIDLTMKLRFSMFFYSKAYD